jgi:succinoglycan biosynthesis protein ExoM
MKHINICICTYRRNKHLASCIKSLCDQVCPNDIRISISVIDNDVQQSAEPIIQESRNISPFILHYFCEPRRGIPLARNRALVESLKMHADWIAFIDDDEQAEKNWIHQLYSYICQHSEKTVVHGRVIPVFPPDTPKHIKELCSPNKIRPTGTPKTACATDNVLFPVSLVEPLGLRFDESSPLAGGTDTIFFTQASNNGFQIFECAEAIVYETVFAERLKMKWLLKRKYRSGITTSWRKQNAGRSSISLIFSSLFKILMHCIVSSLLAVMNLKLQRNKQLLKSARETGILAGTLGLRVNSYAKIES